MKRFEIVEAGRVNKNRGDYSVYYDLYEDRVAKCRDTMRYLVREVYSDGSSCEYGKEELLLAMEEASEFDNGNG